MVKYYQAKFFYYIGFGFSNNVNSRIMILHLTSFKQSNYMINRGKLKIIRFQINLEVKRLFKPSNKEKVHSCTFHKTITTFYDWPVISTLTEINKTPLYAIILSGMHLLQYEINFKNYDVV